MGRDAAGLAELRRRCAEVLRDALGRAELDLGALTEALLAAIRFEPFPDAVPALRELRAAGMRLVAASNWDVSLHEQLERTGLTPLLDGALVLGRGRRRQAGPGDLHARARARGRAARGGAARRRRPRGRRRRRAGRRAASRCCRPRRVARPPPGVRRIASLAELPALCA